MKKHIISALLLLHLLAAGCAADDGAVHGKLGSPVETAFLTFTVAGAGWSDGGAAAPDPQEGKRYLWVEVQIKNTSDRQLTLYYDEFDLYIDGAPRFPEPIVGERQLAEQQVLHPNGDATGGLLYLVPEDATKLELVYDEYYQGDAPGKRYKVELRQKDIGKPTQ